MSPILHNGILVKKEEIHEDTILLYSPTIDQTHNGLLWQIIQLSNPARNRQKNMS